MSNTNEKFLGVFMIEYIVDPDSDNPETDDLISVFVPENEEIDLEGYNYYRIDNFMKSSDNDSRWHGIAGESNTSSIACILDDTGESAELYRIW